MRSLLGALAALLLLVPGSVTAQGPFHSTQAANLPTAETLPQGLLLFEISHRFDTPISEGGSAFWGLDGPVSNRLGLAYAAHDRVLLGVQRSNYQDNLELTAKVALVRGGSPDVPFAAAAIGGLAWNTEVIENPAHGAEDNEMQAYAGLALNAGVGERVALGVVPVYLHNPNIFDFESDDGFSVGVNGQVYFTDSFSFLGEWIVSEERPGLEEDSGTFGFELETRGHFFKLVITNQARLNHTQVLRGTPRSFDPDEWRLGFNITRLLEP